MLLTTESAGGVSGVLRGDLNAAWTFLEDDNPLSLRNGGLKDRVLLCSVGSDTLAGVVAGGVGVGSTPSPAVEGGGDGEHTPLSPLMTQFFRMRAAVRNRRYTKPGSVFLEKTAFCDVASNVADLEVVYGVPDL